MEVVLSLEGGRPKERRVKGGARKLIGSGAAHRVGLSFSSSFSPALFLSYSSPSTSVVNKSHTPPSSSPSLKHLSPTSARRDVTNPPLLPLQSTLTNAPPKHRAPVTSIHSQRPLIHSALLCQHLAPPCSHFFYPTLRLFPAVCRQNVAAANRR